MAYSLYHIKTYIYFDYIYKNISSLYIWYHNIIIVTLSITHLKIVKNIYV